MEFDYIVIGAGSAGCVVASRLSEDPGVSVCLIEAGGPDSSVLTRAPLGFVAEAQLKKNSVHYQTMPQPGLNGRRGFQPRGRVLGGSSSVNAMVYCRGHRSDYDHWAELGNPGWDWASVLPLFKKAEDSTCFGANDWHGVGGPLGVDWLRSGLATTEAFLQACEQAGVPRTPDYNGAQQDGCWPAQVTQRGGERCSAAKAFLTPHLSRPNLKVVTQAVAARVLLDGRRATGIAYHHGGQLRQVRARCETVLCGGAFGSPQLLLLSGIGPQAELQRHGIAVAHALPGVGQNLQDHIDYVQTWRVPSHTETFGASLRGAAKVAAAMLEWRRQRTGMITSPFATAGAFVRSTPDAPVPDLQLVFVLGIVDNHARKLHLGHGISCHVEVLRPFSRGSVGLNGTDPRQAPRIDPQFLSDERDLALLLRGAQLQQRILESSPFDGIRGPMLYPTRLDDPAGMATDIRRRADTQYHPVGTCRMGPASDPMAVVDAQLRVHGIAGLRVADASIMPTLIGGNTNAPTVMIAEKASDLIRARAPL